MKDEMRDKRKTFAMLLQRGMFPYSYIVEHNTTLNNKDST